MENMRNFEGVVHVCVVYIDRGKNNKSAAIKQKSAGGFRHKYNAYIHK
jgi:nitrate reductase NapAB chaperone NapD